MSMNKQPGFVKILQKFGVGLALSCAMAPAMADCTQFVCENTRVLLLYTRADGGAYVQVSGNTAALNCSRFGGTYLTLPSSSPRFKEIYASLLASQMAERNVTVRIDIGSPDCSIAYITTAGT